MRTLELLAPAKDCNIGIAAIDCGADAVYIAAEHFGARQAAGNSMQDISKLCEYAHRYGAKIFLTLNTILFDNELQDAAALMAEAQNAGVDAIIVQDMAVPAIARQIPGFNIPLHASTQCAIRTPEQAKFLEAQGFSRLILERELSLEDIRAIRAAVNCELEFFVHGALCVCYSGNCYLSSFLTGRSANRGACAQPCRSRYNLVDEDSGRILVRDKALLSLKDYKLKSRIAELAEAGICSFKIEGRLKNESYVRNLVRDYSQTLDELCDKFPASYCRSSFGTVTGGFVPDPDKTFNRGYTRLFIDGRRDKWAAMDSAKSMGEYIGKVRSVNGRGDFRTINIEPASRDIKLNNGDGFAYISSNGVVAGFRGDLCSGNSIQCRIQDSINTGTRLYRNINTAFEKEILSKPCKRLLQVKVSLDFRKESLWTVSAKASSEDGRQIIRTFSFDCDTANNTARMEQMLEAQLGKTADIYSFHYLPSTTGTELPLLKSADINMIRRTLSEDLNAIPTKVYPLQNSGISDMSAAPGPVAPPCSGLAKANISNRLSEAFYRTAFPSQVIVPAYELEKHSEMELMRTKYCIRYELGLCPKYQHADPPKHLALLNNGVKLRLHFDCANCEMTVTE